MKIAMIAPSPFVPVPAAGTAPLETVIATLSKGLMKRGHSIILFGSSHSTLQCDRRAMDESSFQNFPRDNPTRFQQECLLGMYMDWALQGAASSGADVIHVHRWGLLRKLFFCPTPQVCTMHLGVLPEDTPEKQKSIRFEAIRTIVELCKSFPNADYALLSNHQRDAWSEVQFPPEERTHVVPLGLDLREFPYRTDKEDYVLYLGRISHEKGVHFAIEGASKAGVPIKIAGPRTLPGVTRPGIGEEPEYEERIFKMIEEEPLAEYVGEVTGEYKAELLGKARALLFPSLWESFGLSMIESMACGTPVIGFRRGPMPEIIVDGVTGYLVDDAEEMARRIGDLDRLNPRDARQRVEDHYTMDTLAAGYERVYQRAIDRRLD